jgi:integrase
VAQLRQLSAALTYDDRAIARDLPDLVSFLMATGLRIGEACGLAWTAVDLDAGTSDVRAAVVRVKGRGLYFGRKVPATGAAAVLEALSHVP